MGLLRPRVRRRRTSITVHRRLEPTPCDPTRHDHMGRHRRPRPQPPLHDRPYMGDPLARTTYTGTEAWPGSDHIPQSCTISAHLSPPPPRGYSWTRMDADHAEGLAERLFRQPLDPAQSPTELDGQVETFITRLSAIARTTTPPKGHSRGTRFPRWDFETQEAMSHLYRCERRIRQGDHSHEALEASKEAKKAQRRTLRRASTKHWRQLLETTSNKDTDVWELEKWARLRSHAPTEPVKLPYLRHNNTNAISHQDKAEALSQRFFPQPTAELPPTGPHSGPQVFISQIITLEEIQAAVYHTSPRKAAGPDDLSNALIRAWGEPLFRALAHIATSSLRLQH